MTATQMTWAAPLPKVSPYMSRFITLRIGKSSDEYKVPEALLNRYSQLSRRLHNTSETDVILNLEDVDSEIGHTFVHFLYTNCYEELERSLFVWGESKEEMAFRHGILVYSAAIKYGIEELAELAKHQVSKVSASLSLSGLVENARKVFNSLPNGDIWFSEFIKGKIFENYEENNDVFTRENFFHGFGKHKTFDPYLCRCIVEVYEKRITHLMEKNQSEIEEHSQGSIHEDSVPAEPPGPGAKEDVLKPDDLDGEQPAEASSLGEAEAQPLSVEETLLQDVPQEVDAGPEEEPYLEKPSIEFEAPVPNDVFANEGYANEGIEPEPSIQDYFFSGTTKKSRLNKKGKKDKIRSSLATPIGPYA